MSRLLIVSPWPPPADGIGAHSQMLAGALAERVGVAVAAPGERDGGDVHRVLGLRDGAARAALLRELQPAALYVQFAIAGFGAALPGLEHLLRLARAQGIRTVMVFHEPERDLAALPVARPRHLPAAGGTVRRAGGARRARPRRARRGRRRGGADRGDPARRAVPARRDGHRRGACAAPLRTARAGPAGARLRPRRQGRRRAGGGGAGRAVAGVGRDDRDRRRAAPPARCVPPVRAGRRAPPGGAARRRPAWAGDRIRFCGFVPDEDLPALLAAATAMVLPYRRITQSGIAHLCVAGAVPAVASQPARAAGDARRRRRVRAARRCRGAGRRARQVLVRRTGPGTAAGRAGGASRCMAAGRRRRPHRGAAARSAADEAPEPLTPVAVR